MTYFPSISHMPPLPLSKQDLRQYLRRMRRTLSEELRQDYQLKITDYLLQQPKVQMANIIAGYDAFDGEVNLHEFYVQWQKQHPQGSIVYPIHTKNDPLNFYQADSWEHAKNLSYRTPIGTQVQSACIDVILTPGIAFGKNGQRLGFGGGYYDRTLDNLRRNSWSGSVFGVAFLLQSVPELIQEEWDQPLTALVNETGCYYFEENRDTPII